MKLNRFTLDLNLTFKTASIPLMNEVSRPLPASLPGINIEFGLKQCIGNVALLQSLLQRFWQDYREIPVSIAKTALDNQESRQLLHSFKGAAINLGMSELGDLTQQIIEDTQTTEPLLDEHLQQFREELQRVGTSIESFERLLAD